VPYLYGESSIISFGGKLNLYPCFGSDPIAPGESVYAPDEISSFSFNFSIIPFVFPV